MTSMTFPGLSGRPLPGAKIGLPMTAGRATIAGRTQTIAAGMNGYDGTQAGQMMPGTGVHSKVLETTRYTEDQFDPLVITGGNVNKNADVFEQIKGNAAALWMPLALGSIGLYVAGLRSPKAFAFLFGGAILGTTAKSMLMAADKEEPNA